MTNEQLIAAALVHELAVKFRQLKAASEKDAIDAAAPDQQAREPWNDFMARYAAQHPVVEFVPAAMQRLKDVNEAMDAFTKSNP